MNDDTFVSLVSDINKKITTNLSALYSMGSSYLAYSPALKKLETIKSQIVDSISLNRKKTDKSDENIKLITEITCSPNQKTEDPAFTNAKKKMSAVEKADLYQALMNQDEAKANIVLFYAHLTFSQQSPGLYEYLVRNNFSAKKLRAGFKLLGQTKLSPEEDEPLYQALLADPENASDLALAFYTLASANISYRENSEIYQKMIENPLYAVQLANQFVLLKQDNLFSRDLVLTALHHFRWAANLVMAFRVLKKERFFYEDHLLFYQMLNRIPSQADGLALLFVKLIKLNILDKNNYLCYVPFERLVESSSYENFEEVTEATCLLAAANNPNTRNLELYRFLADDPSRAKKVAKAFSVLVSHNLTWDKNDEYFRGINSYRSIYEQDLINLAEGFVILQKAGFSYFEQRSLYQGLGDCPYYATLIAKRYVVVKNEGFTYQNHLEIYENILRRPFAEEHYTDALLMLHKQIPYAKTHPLHKALLNTSFPLERAKIFCTLLKVGFSYSEHAALFDAIIAKAHKVTALQAAFEALDKGNLEYVKNIQLCLAIIENETDENTLSKVMDVLKALGVQYDKEPGFFSEYILARHGKFSLLILSFLESAGFTFQKHKKPLVAVLDLLNTETLNMQVVINIVQDLCALAKKGLVEDSEPDFEKQLQEFMAIVQRHLSPSLTFGPLDKSKATHEVEVLLEEICKVDVEKEAIISFRALSENYFITLPGREEINLSLLLKNANLTQLTLSDKLIAEIDKCLQKLLGNRWGSMSITSSKLRDQLPIVQQKAIEIYTTRQYININRLFRSEPLKTSDLIHQNEAQNNLVYFLLGCLLNDAANKLKLLPEEFRDTSGSILDRGERLSEEVIKARTQNTWIFPALTSFSIFKDGSPCFNGEGTTRTKMQESDNTFVTHAAEGEVLFAQGEQVLTVQGPGYLVSSIKRSPSLDPKNHYFSHLALLEAFEKHLSIEYAEEKSAITLQDKTIVRPNHGMPHTYRMMTMIELVIQYFANYAKDEAFKTFCQMMEDEEIEWLRVASAFSITGRESEISAMSDLKLYDSYREKCKVHFLSFVETKAPHISDTMKERMADIIRYMGNPHYEGKENTPGVNDHPNLKELQLRNFSHRLLTVAHKIDLVRCYSAGDYSRAMQLCHDLVEKSEAQENALTGLIRYVIELNKAHGNKLDCDIGADGKLFTVNLPYQDIFAEVSLSVKRLFEVTQTVKRPLITQQFEYSAARALKVGP